MNAESMALVASNCRWSPPAKHTALDGADRAVQQRGHHGGADQPGGHALEEALMQDLADDAAVAQNVQQARGMWQLRESILLAQAQTGLNIKHDIALPVSSIPDFVTRVDALVLRHAPGARLTRLRASGDGQPALL